MFERFTDRGRRVMVLAQEEARLLAHNFIGTEHLLLGLIDEGDGVAARALTSLGIRAEAVRERVAERIHPAGASATGSPPFTPRAKKVLELSLREALQLGHHYIGTEHLLLGIVREGEGVAAQVLVSLGVDLLRLRQEIMRLLSEPTSGDHNVAGVTADLAVRERAKPADLATFGPLCPSCRVLLDGQIAYRMLAVPPERDRAAGPITVTFVYCRRCGVTIANMPTVPNPSGSETRAVRLVGPTRGGGPPIPTREFPEALWNAHPPESVSRDDVVEVRHIGRFRSDGKLQGVIGGSPVDLTVELPRTAGSATGAVGDEAVDVNWSVSYDSRDDFVLPATVQGLVGDHRVDLRGRFIRAPDYWFDRASLEGTLAGEDLIASVERASGGYGSTDTIVATGTFGNQAFEVFAALGGTLERGRIRGTFDGRSVHLDITTSDQPEATVRGSCPAPTTFVLLLIASVAYFA